jgi:hypothetical protein
VEIKRKEGTDLQVLILPGNGAHPIFLPRQKKHASGGFLSSAFKFSLAVVEELLLVVRPIDGDCAEFRIT